MQASLFARLAVRTWRLIGARAQAWWHTRHARITRNSVFLLSSQAVERIAGYGFLLYITRVFGPVLYGTYHTVVTLVGIAGMLGDFGLSNLITKDIAKDRARASEYIAKIFPLKVILTLGAVSLILALSRILGYPWDLTALVALAGLSSLLGVALGLVGPCLMGYERMDLTSITSMLGSLLTAALGVLALSLGLNLWGVFVGWFLVGGVQAGLVTWMARRQGMTIHPRLDAAFGADILRRATPFALIGIGLIHHTTAVVILSRIDGPVAVGLYGAARKPLELLVLIPTSMMGALYPVMASYHRQASPLFGTTYFRNVRLMMSLAVPIILACTALGEDLVVFLFGEAFRPAGDALRVLSWALAFAFVTSPADNVIFSAERVQAFLPFFWLKVVIHVGLDLVLIPRWSFMGASVATLASEVFDFVTHVYFIRSILGRVPSFWAIGRGVLPAAVGMGGVMFAFGGQHVLLGLTGGMLAYAVMLPWWRRAEAGSE